VLEIRSRNDDARNAFDGAFIVMAASALIAVPLYAQEVDVTGSSPSGARESPDNALEVTSGLGYAQVRRHRCRPAESYCAASRHE
jgi:hypothetical protein